MTTIDKQFETRQAKNKQLNANQATTNSVARKHAWVTVVNPMNHQTLLQACDQCGVVKSENSIIRSCKAPSGQALISSSMASSQKIAM